MDGHLKPEKRPAGSVGQDIQGPEDYLRRVNVLSEEKKQQVIALGRLGWSLRRIERTVHIRRETAAAYLKAAGVPVRPPGGWGRKEAKPAIEVSTGFGADLAQGTVVPVEPQPSRSPSSSACEPYRDFIEAQLAKGRNAIVTARYASVKRFVRKLHGGPAPEARVVIETPPGEDYGESGVMVRAASPVARADCWAAHFAAPSFP